MIMKPSTRYFLYAQGVPFLIGLLTMIVDSQRGENDSHFPNVGVYGCFLGTARSYPKPSPFETAHFIYFEVKSNQNSNNFKNYCRLIK